LAESKINLGVFMAENPDGGSKTKKSMMQKKRFIIPLAIVVIAGLFWAGYYYFYAVNQVTTDDAFVEGHFVLISPKISGHIVKVCVDDNQEIKAGDLLAEIDQRDYQTKAEMAQANLDAARARAEQAEEDVRRYNKLTPNYEISKQEIERVLSQARVAKAVSSQASAALEQANLELSYTKIYAPAAGVITEKVAEAGAFVQPGQALLTIVTPQRWVVANLKETELKNIVPGARVSMVVDAYPDKIFYGRVDSIQRGTGAKFSLLPAENASGNYVKVVQRVPVKIVFDSKPDPRYPLGLGMSVVPSISTNPKDRMDENE
jgi:membrane fusion protein, multidrug efflux system